MNARRTRLMVTFNGQDISSSLHSYLKSMTYTDNEGDEADDLQIVLHDLEGIWMQSWLSQAVAAAASQGGGSAAGGGTGHSAGEPVQLSGAGFHYTSLDKTPLVSKTGTFYFYDGLLINGKYRITSSPEHCGQQPVGQHVTGWVNAEDCTQSGGDAGAGQTPGGMVITAAIVRENWTGPGSVDMLDCGQFELDSVECSGPPDEITIKATSLPFKAQIRQTKKNKSWEGYTLSGIAKEMAANNGMGCSYLAKRDVTYGRVEQRNTSDIAFLLKLCTDAGIDLKATGKELVLYDQREYESRGAVMVLYKKGGGYSSYRLSIGQAETQYQSCRVKYTDPQTGKYIEGIAKVEDYNAKSKTNQQLELTAKVSSISEAKALAEKRLREHNKFCQTAEFGMQGNTAAAAGCVVLLPNWGSWSGNHLIRRAVHTVGENGYETTIETRKVLEGY